MKLLLIAFAVPLLLQGQTINAVSPATGGVNLAAGGCFTQPVTVTGATRTGMTVTVAPRTFPGDGVTWEGYINATNSVTVKVCSIIAAFVGASIYDINVLTGVSTPGGSTSGNSFRQAFCMAGICNNDQTTGGTPVILAIGTTALTSCKALFYGVVPSSPIVVAVRKNSTSISTGTSLLSATWTFSTATLGTPVAYPGGFAAVTLADNDQVAIYMTGTSGQGMTVVCQ
jgi:hypothetical protein